MVCGAGDIGAANLLRRHVGQRANRAGGARAGGVAGNACHPEIIQQDYSAVGQEHIAGLYVAMNNALLVGIVQCRGKRLPDFQNIGCLQ